MSETEQLTVSIRGNDVEPRSGLWRVKLLDKRDRAARAVKIWAGLWLLGLAVLPIPIVHLIVPAAMVIAGPIAGYLRYRVVRVAESVSGVCPVHGGEISIPLEPATQPPLWTYCPVCKAPLHVLQEPAAA